jgi:hypothetical protein
MLASIHAPQLRADGSGCVAHGVGYGPGIVLTALRV